MAKIVNILKYIDENIEFEPCDINIYKFIYEFEEVLNVSNITMNIGLINNQKELIDLEIKFQNVTTLSLKEVSGVIYISGFEIIDHKEDGWNVESRFEIHDFENDELHFMCQDFNIKRL